MISSREVSSRIFFLSLLLLFLSFTFLVGLVNILVKQDFEGMGRSNFVLTLIKLSFYSRKGFSTSLPPHPQKPKSANMIIVLNENTAIVSKRSQRKVIKSVSPSTRLHSDLNPFFNRRFHVLHACRSRRKKAGECEHKLNFKCR